MMPPIASPSAATPAAIQGPREWVGGSGAVSPHETAVAWPGLCGGGDTEDGGSAVAAASARPGFMMREIRSTESRALRGASFISSRASSATSA